jgi:hypothetical protein
MGARAATDGPRIDAARAQDNGKNSSCIACARNGPVPAGRLAGMAAHDCEPEGRAVDFSDGLPDRRPLSQGGRSL